MPIKYGACAAADLVIQPLPAAGDVPTAPKWLSRDHWLSMQCSHAAAIHIIAFGYKGKTLKPTSVGMTMKGAANQPLGELTYIAGLEL